MSVEGPSLQHPAFTRLVLPALRAIAWPLLFLLGPFAVRGKYRVPARGGLLVLANHISDMDPVVVQAACPREIYFMAKSELFEMRGLGWLIQFFRAFPVRRGEPDRDAIKRAVAYLKAGKVVGVFPEGQLSETGELQELKPGVALILRMAGCPAICLGIKNADRALPYGAVVPRPAFRKIEANWGEPREFGPHPDPAEFLAWCRAELLSLTE